MRESRPAADFKGPRSATNRTPNFGVATANRTPVERFTASRSATDLWPQSLTAARLTGGRQLPLSLGAAGQNRTGLSSFSDWRLDHNGLRYEIWWMTGESNPDWMVPCPASICRWTRIHLNGIMSTRLLPSTSHRNKLGAEGDTRNPMLRILDTTLSS